MNDNAASLKASDVEFCVRDCDGAGGADQFLRGRPRPRGGNNGRVVEVVVNPCSNSTPRPAGLTKLHGNPKWQQLAHAGFASSHCRVGRQLGASSIGLVMTLTLRLLQLKQPSFDLRWLLRGGLLISMYSIGILRGIRFDCSEWYEGSGFVIELISLVFPIGPRSVAWGSENCGFFVSMGEGPSLICLPANGWYKPDNPATVGTLLLFSGLQDFRNL